MTWDLYGDCIDESCRRCKAPAGERCTSMAGQMQRMPCVTRLLGRPVAAPPKAKRTRRA